MLPVALNVTPEERPLLVASTGGHLEQLHLWAKRWGLLDGGAFWLTFPNEQSHSLLARESARYIPYVAPRDVPGVLRTARVLAAAVKEFKAETLVSTGAAVAVSAAIVGTILRKRVVYIESLARVGRLSVTGRILQHYPEVERYVQSDEMANSRYMFAGSILDQYRRGDERDPEGDPRHILVTLGTIRPFRFDRAIRYLSKILDGFDVIWQIGDHTIEPTFGRVYRQIPRSDLQRFTREADVVLCHAGVGSVLMALSCGKFPLVIPRISAHGEHIDDHQLETVTMLVRRGLVGYVPIEAMSRDDLIYAQRQHILSDNTLSPKAAGVRQ